MKLKIRFLLVGLLVAGEIAAAAEKNAVSVYQINPWVDGTVLGVAALGAGVPVLFEDEIINKSCHCLAEDVNRFDRPVTKMHSKTASTASHLVVTSALIFPVVHDYFVAGWSEVYAEDMMVYVQTLAINSAVANMFRYGVQRPRPDAYQKPQPVTEAQEFASFYSGHTASTFAGLTAFSMTYTYRNGPRVWPWVLTGTVGVLDGWLRAQAGRHFYTDSLMGAAMGLGIGYLVPRIHKRKSDWSLYPAVGRDEAQLVFQSKF